MIRRRMVAAPAAASLALFAALAVTAATDEVVTITASLEPAQLEIQAGTTVTWLNQNDERHRMRSEDGPAQFDSGNLEPGESFSFTFAVEGSYPYYDHRDRDDTSYLGMIIVGGAIDPDAPLPARGSISIIDRSFRPASFAVATGGTIEWSNDDGEAHTVTATEKAFDSGIMNGGATFSQTFTAPGDYPYSCLIHPEMRGAITVADAVVQGDVGSAVDPGDGEAVVEPSGETVGDSGPAVSTIDRSFQPDAVEVIAGETVTWSNDDTEGHTVTAVDGSFNSGVMTVGDVFTMAFETPGTFDYFCAIHPEMTGTVTVGEPGAG